MKGLKRVLEIALAVCVAWKVVAVSAGPNPSSFGDFKTVSINGAAGNLVSSNGTFHLSNSTTNDSGFCFAQQPFSDNGQVTARIRRPAQSSAKAGILFRQTTNSISSYVGMFLTASDTIFERQLGTNELPISTVRTNESFEWLRIVRNGTSFSGFYSTDGTNWIQISADTIEMPAEIYAGFALSGNGEAVFDEVRMTSAHLASPTESSHLLAPTNVLFRADVASLGAKPVRVEFFGNAKKVSEATNFPYQTMWSNALGGTYSFVARITDESGAEFFTEPVNCQIKLPPASARFLRVDVKTKGNWKESYGSEGYLIPSDHTNSPLDLKLELIGARLAMWENNTTEDRGVMRAQSPNRIASSWFNPRQIELDLDLKDGGEHKLAVYFLDWDHHDQRLNLVEVMDSSGGKTLDSRKIGSFSGGKYLVWSLTGHVKIKITALENWVAISGIFFDP